MNKKILCPACNIYEAREEHTCPFAKEISNDENLCVCCEECTFNCAMEV